MILRNDDCFESSSNEGQCFCCLPHFISTGKVTLELGTKHETWRNIVFRGRRFEKCLVKKYPCTDYLDYYDWDLVSWFAERYSRLVPTQDNGARCSDEEIRLLAADVKPVPVQLSLEESLADMQGIVRRVLSANQPPKPVPTPRNRRARRASARKRQEPRDPSPMRPKPEPPTQYPTWVFCTNDEWNRARLVDDFRPDTNYKLVWFYDGNMIRIHKDEFAKSELVRIQTKKPESIPQVSKAHLVSRQIYIYMCLDGFWEYSFPKCPETSPGLFPYHNPMDSYEPPYGTTFSQVEHAIVQLINSGNLEMPTDVEKGDEIVSYIFSQSFDKLMNEKQKIKSTGGFSSSSSESGTSPAVVRKVTKKQPSTVPRVPAPATGKYTPENLPFEITLEPARELEDIPARKSGINNIAWQKGTKNCWNAHVQISNSQTQVYFKPKPPGSDQDVKDALELAKEHLRTVLLPRQAAYQLNSEPNNKFRFNPK